MTMFKTKTTIITALMTGAVFPMAYENKPGWKMDGDKIALDGSGNPIYLDASGREMTVDGGTISRLNKEAKDHREAKEKAEGQLAAYTVDGKPLDPAAAKKALETVGKLDAKALIDAGEVDKVKEQITGQFTAQIAEKDKALEAANKIISDMRIDGVFANSEFVRDKLAMPRDFFQDAMRKHFKDENGKVTAYDRAGNPVYSKKRVGELADPDEALELLVEAHPQKDTILKAPQQGGSGNGGGGGNRGGGRTMRRAEFDALDGVAKAQNAALMAKGELTVVD